jgi:hypothetical protein
MNSELCRAVGKPCANAKAEGGTRLAADGIMSRSLIIKLSRHIHNS